MRLVLRSLCHAHLILALLALTVLATERNAGRYGDNIQIALPVLGWACAGARGAGAGGEYALRFLAMLGAAHASKAALGDAPVNLRPKGSEGGMPSAHTAAAVFGASSLVHDCIVSHPTVRAAVVIAAAYVGASRIEVQAHDIWQVLAGALLGWGADRLLRRESRTRRALGEYLNRFRMRILSAEAGMRGRVLRRIGVNA